ncbi:MAG: signal peptidase I [Candidatus Binataceae bacterium]
MSEPLRTFEPHKAAAKPVPAARKSVLREYAEALGIAMLLALLIRTFFIQAYEIPSGSMEPTLLVGDHILANKLVYGFRMPDSIFGLTPGGLPYGHYLFRLEPVHRGDVVVFVYPRNPTEDYIKRVIGIPGDVVQVKAGKVWLNGAPMPDPHAHFEVPDNQRSAASVRDYFGPVTVPPGNLFMMGDNRDDSSDSRFWGFAPQDNVEGRAMFIYWSWDSDEGGILPIRWSRFGKEVR